jgi:hypothetical protein
MAYVPSTVATRDFSVTGNTVSKPRGFFRWFFEAMMQSRQRHAEREIARYLNNGKFTDETEREIERRFLSKPPSF